MATHLDSTSNHARSSREPDRLLKAFSELDDASMETREAALDKQTGARRRPASRLTEPVLQRADYSVLLDVARQGRAFAKRLGGAPN
jgi:hypothetical protein